MSTRASKVFEKQIKELTFGSMLRAYRTTHDLDQTELGKLLKISKQNVCDIEKGRQLVSPKTAKAYAKTLGLSVQVALTACLQDQLKAANASYIVDLRKHA